MVNTSSYSYVYITYYNYIVGIKGSKLSGGQKQMLCIASVLVLEPNCIVFDEPTSHLDPWARKEFWNIIKYISTQSNTGIIIISQLPEDINNFDHISVLNEGQIVFNDSFQKFKHIDKLPDGLEFPEDLKLERLKN